MDTVKNSYRLIGVPCSCRMLPLRHRSFAASLLVPSRKPTWPEFSWPIVSTDHSVQRDANDLFHLQFFGYYRQKDNWPCDRLKFFYAQLFSCGLASQENTSNDITAVAYNYFELKLSRSSSVVYACLCVSVLYVCRDVCWRKRSVDNSLSLFLSPIYL